MTRRKTAHLVIAAASLLSLAACRKKPETAPVAEVTVDVDAARRSADSIAAANVAQRRADSIDAANRAAATAAADMQRLQAELSAALSQRVQFDYDRDALRDDARAVLEAKAPILLANPGIALAIIGHTDERGTAEYNLALGQRRAATVKRYLVGKGIAESRLSTQSLGDSEPLATGTDEGSYAQNRRAEFEVSVNGPLSRPR